MSKQKYIRAWMGSFGMSNGTSMIAGVRCHYRYKANAVKSMRDVGLPVVEDRAVYRVAVLRITPKLLEWLKANGQDTTKDTR